MGKGHFTRATQHKDWCWQQYPATHWSNLLSELLHVWQTNIHCTYIMRLKNQGLISNCFQERKLQSHIVLGPLKQLGN